VAWHKLLLEDDASIAPAPNVIPIADGLGKLDGWVTPRRGLEWFKQVGTAPEVFRIAGQANGRALSTGVPGDTRYYAMPLVSPRGGTVDMLSIEVTTALAAQAIRLGIYEATSDTDLTPGALVVDAGIVQVNTIGVKTKTVNVSLEPDRLYYLVLQCDSPITPNTAAIRTLDPDGAEPLLHAPGTWGTMVGVGWTNDPGVHGAFQDPFPVPAVALTSAEIIPAIGVRFSA